MKVTFVSRGSPEMLSDLVADGLIRTLGRENVHIALGPGELRYSPDYNPFFFGYDQANSIDFYETDAIVVSVRSGLQDLRNWSLKTGRPNTAVLDGEDDAIIRTDYLAAARTYFKREYLVKGSYDSRIRPLPFGAIPEPVPSSPAEGAERMPVYYKCRINDLFRVDIQKRLIAMGINTDMGNILQKASYNRGLASALVGISVRGGGWDTYRYWETPYFGPCLLSQRMGIVIPGNFIDGEEAVFFDSADDFERKLRALIDNPERTRQIAQNGKRACHSRHLSIHRAATLLAALA